MKDLKKIARLAEIARKSMSTTAKWKTVESFTQAEFATIIPVVRKLKGDAIIFHVTDKDGDPVYDRNDNPFLKAKMTTPDGTEVTFELSYQQKSLDEEDRFADGDILKEESIRFCYEEKLGEAHLFIDGELA